MARIIALSTSGTRWYNHDKGHKIWAMSYGVARLGQRGVRTDDFGQCQPRPPWPDALNQLSVHFPKEERICSIWVFDGVLCL